MKRCAVVLLAMMASSCKLTAMLMPVAGPLSEQRPVPMMNLRADGIMGNTGKLSFALPSGEKCEGRWSSSGGSSATLATGSLLSQYGSTFISGYAVSTGGGQNMGQALANCVNGSTFQFEFVTGSGTGHGYGIAKDNNENVYRMVF